MKPATTSATINPAITALLATTFALILVFAAPIQGRAQVSGTYTNPGADFNWGTASNWTPSVVPGAAAGDAATFNAATNTALNGATITLGADRTLGSLTATGPAAVATPASTLTLTGNNLIFNNGGLGSTLTLTDGLNLKIASGITLADALSINNTSGWAGNIDITGSITGAGKALNIRVDSASAYVNLAGAINGASTALTKTGGGLLVLGTANTYTGGVTLNEGTLRLGNNTALGTGTLTIANNANSKTLSTLAGANIVTTNGLALNGDLTIAGGGTLAFNNGGGAIAIGAARTLSIDNVTTLNIGSGRNITGGALTKNGTGTLILGSNGNAFTSLTVNGGYLNTANIAGVMTLGIVDTGKNILGSGNITANGSDTVINLNGQAGSTVNLAGSTILLYDGATLNVTTAAVTLAGGTIDFGSAATKGNLNFGGNVTLGSATVQNASGARMTLGKDLIFLDQSTIAGSGLDFVLNGSGTQNLSQEFPGTGLTISGNVTHSGTGTVNVSNLGNLALAKNLTLTAGNFNLDAANDLSVTNGINLNGGSLSLGKANQYNAGNFNAAANGSNVYLNGFDQTFNTLNVGNGYSAIFDLGGNAATSTQLSFNNVTLNSTGLLKIASWQDGANADIVRASSISAANLANVWFYGYNKGAANTAGVLTPNAGFLSTEFDNSKDGSGITGDWKWGTATNWIGDDAFNIPNSAGAIVSFKDAAGNLTGKTITLDNKAWTIGQLNINPTTAATIYFYTGTLIFDSGVSGSAAVVNQKNSSPVMTVAVRLNSDLLLNAESYWNMSGTTAFFTGSGALIKSGSGTFYLVESGASNFSGGLILEQGFLALGDRYNVGSILGSGTLAIRQSASDATADSYTKRAIYGYSLNRYTITNPFKWDADFSAYALSFMSVGDTVLSGTRTIYVSSAATDGNSSVYFGPNLNLVGSGGMVKAGPYTMTLESMNNSFSGGLEVKQGMVTIAQRGDMVLGGLAANKNYLGSGNLLLSGGNIWVDTHNYNNELAAGGLISYTAAGSAFALAGSGTFTLSGTIQGSANNVGIFQSYGDLVFNGGIIDKANLYINTSSVYNPASANTISASAGNGNVVAGYGFSKVSPGVTTLDASVTNFSDQVNVLYLQGGILRSSANNQIATNQSIILQGGALDVNGHTNQLQNFFLRSNGSLLLGTNGGLTFAMRMSGTANWYSDALLTIQNDGASWAADTSNAYVRFTTKPFDITNADDLALLANIGFTGYESGATVSALTGSYYYLLPNAQLTNEWSGASGGPGLGTTWSNAANWLSGTIPNIAGASATVRDADPAISGKTITVDRAVTVGRLNLESSAATYTLAGNGGITIDDGGANNARIKHGGGSILTLSTPVTLASNTEINAIVSNGSGYLNWIGTISGNKSLTKTGVGTLRLSGANSGWTGGFNWNAGLLQIASTTPDVLGSGTWVIGQVNGDKMLIEAYGADRALNTPFVLNGGLQLQQYTELGSQRGIYTNLSLGGNGVLASGTHLIGAAGDRTTNVYQRLIFDGVLSGPGGLQVNNVSNNGFLVFNKTNAFTGDFRFDNNTTTVLVNADNALGQGAIVLKGASWLAGPINTPNAPVRLSNEIKLVGDPFLYGSGNLVFDYSGTSVINGALSLANASPSATSANNIMSFGVNHVLSGTGSIIIGYGNHPFYGNQGVVRMEGANTFSGGVTTTHSYTYIQIGNDSVYNADGTTLKSGALGTGTFTIGASGQLLPYSALGSGITSRTVSNDIVLLSGFAVQDFGAATSDAHRLIFNSKNDIKLLAGVAQSWTIVNGATLQVDSRLADAAPGAPSGFQAPNYGTIELRNGNNQISAGILMTNGILRGIAASGDLVTGTLAAGKNQLGSGQLQISNNSAGTTIELAASGDVYLSGSGIIMNNGMVFSSNAASTTYLDSNSSFARNIGTAIATLKTAGTLAKTGAGTLTQINVKLDTPKLDLRAGTLQFLGSSLLASTQSLTLSGGTLDLNGTSQILGTGLGIGLLSVTGNSNINFSGATASLTVGNISILGGILTVDNWSGNTTTGLGNDRFILTGQTAGTFDNIAFTGYSPGAKILQNSVGQYVIVPFGNTFIWTGSTGNTNWNANNWKQYDPDISTWAYTGAPTTANSSATFDDSSQVNGKSITVGSGITVGSLSFEGTQGQNFTIGSGDLNLDRLGGNSLIAVTGNMNPTINSNLLMQGTGSGSLVINQAGTGTLTLNGAIDGVNKNVIKNGTGQLDITYTGNNTYTNGFILNAGTVRVAGDGAFGSGALTLNGGNLEALTTPRTFANAFNLGGNVALTGTNPITLAGPGSVTASSTLTISATTTISGVLTGDSQLTKSGTGTLNLTAANTNTGGVNLAAGQTNISNNTALGTGTLGITGNATLRIDAANLNIANKINLATTGTIDTAANAATLTGNITGAGTLDKIGTGTLTLSATNSYTGNTNINAGTINATNANALGSGTVNIAGPSTVELAFSSGTLDNNLSGQGTARVTGTAVRIAGNNAGFSGLLDIAPNASALINDSNNLSGSSTIALSGTLTMDAASPMSLTSALSGTGALNNNSAGTLTFGPATGTAFTGTFNQNTGAFAWDANASNALTNATIALNNGLTTIATGSQHATTLTMNGGTTTFTGTAYVDTLNANGGKIAFDQSILTARSLLQQDEAAANTLVVATNITGNIANLNLTSATSTIALQNNAMNGTYNNTLAQTGNTLTLDYQLTRLDLLTTGTLNGDTAALAGAADMTAQITGTGNLQIAATNAITLTNGTNTYTGTTLVTTGTLIGGATNIIATSTMLNLSPNAAFATGTYNQTINNLSGAGVYSNSTLSILHSTLDTAFAGVLTGTGGVEKTGAATLTLSGSNTYTGTTTVSTGTLQAANANALGKGDVTVASNADLLVNATGTLANNIAGSGTASIAPAANITLTGTNTIAAWDITGTAIASGTQTLGTGNVNIAQNGLLTLATATNWNLDNALTGQGTVRANLATGGTLTLTSTTGNAFAGTLDMLNGYLQLDTPAATMLTNATLKLSASGSTHVNQNNTIGGLTFNGGGLYVATDTTSFNITGTLTVGTLDTTGGGTIYMNKPTSVIDDTDVINAPSFFDQTGTIQSMIVRATGSVNGIGTALDLRTPDGNPIANPLITAVTQIPTGTVGTAYHNYKAEVTGSGIYWAYGLTRLDANAGQNIVLSNSNATSNTLNAQLTGTGGFIMNGTGSYLIGNATSNYTGTTQILSGTVQALTNNALGNTTELDLAANTAFDLNANTQTIGALNSTAGSTLNLNSGSLAILAGGTSNGALTGTGQLDIAGHLTISGSNNLPAHISLTGTATLDNTAGLGTTGTLSIASNAELQLAATGTLSKTLEGTGNTALLSAANVTLSSTNTAYTGTFTTAATSNLIATTTANLGTATIANSGTLTMANTANETLANTLTGTGALVKDATGNLTIATANTAYTGNTLITAGTLTLTNLLGTGTGNVSNNSILDLAAAGAYANNITGTGTTTVSSVTVAITGNNQTTWNITPTGAALVTEQQNLGDLATHIDGLLAITTATAWNYANALTGTGTLAIDLGAPTNAITFASASGSSFRGTVLLATSTIALEGQNTTALTNATLQLNAGNITTVGTGTQNIGNLTLNGGRIDFAATVPADIVSPNFIATNTLTLNSGTVAVNLPNLAITTTIAQLPLLQQDEGRGVQLISSSTTLGDPTTLTLADAATGAPINQSTALGIIQNNTTVATGSYNYALAANGANGNGLYATYRLLALDIHAGQTLTLDQDTNPNGGDDMTAKITGAGNLVINAASSITLKSDSNTYTGTTTVNTGTLISGADNALGNTAYLTVADNAAYNLNGHAQTIATGGTIASANGLQGTGTLNLTTGLFDIAAANTNLAAHINTTGTIRIADVQSLGNSSALALNTAAATLDINTANNGELATTLTGNGTLIKNGASTVVITHANALTGNALVNTGTLTATHNAALGTANINIAANAAFEYRNIASGTAQNTISGSGALNIVNSNLAIDRSNSMATANLTTATVIMLNNNALGTATTTINLDAPSTIWIAAPAAQLGTLNLNNGTLAFAPTATSTQTPTTFRAATIATLGNANGNLIFNLNIDGAAGTVPGTVKADYLKITNDGTGTHTVHINHTGAPGADATAIDLIDAGTATATYKLDTPTNNIDVGMSSFELIRGGTTATAPDMKHWYLADNGLSNAADAIIDTASMIGTDWFYSLDSLHQRMGDVRQENLSHAQTDGGNDAAEKRDSATTGNVWVRTRGYQINANNQLSGLGFKQYSYGVTGGVDKAFTNANATTLIGAMIDMGNIDRQFTNNGNGTSNSLSVGLYATWLHRDGWHADFVAKADRYKNRFDAHTTDNQILSGRYSSQTQGLSLEIGRMFKRADGWWVEPNLQAATVWINGAGYDTTPDAKKLHVHIDPATAQQYRAQVRFGRQFLDTKWYPYAKVAAVAVDGTGGTITASSKTLTPDYTGKRVEFGFGTTYRINAISQIYFDYEYAKAAHYERPWSINLGYRRLW